MPSFATTSRPRRARSPSPSLAILLAVCSDLYLTLSATAGFAAPPDRQALRAALCRDRSPCHVGKIQEAGQTGGEKLTVVELSLTEEPTPSEVPPIPGVCSSSERWVVARRGTGEISAHLLVRLCNDGYGSRGLGEDQIEVAPNRFTYTRAGGSAWMWSQTSVVQLAPLVLLSETQRAWWTLGDASSTGSWRWTDWVGFGSSRAPSCEAARPPKGPIASAYQPIPRVALDEAFRATGWRTADFSACASRIDSRGGASEASPGGGFVTFGKPATRVEATVRLLLSSENELFIEVADETWVPSAKSWLVADHLELWLGSPTSSSLECADRRGPLFQWGIGLDGTVYPAFGQPEQRLDVERAEHSSSIRFKVQLPASLVSTLNDSWRITVAYSDSADGRGQKRIIATSKLTYGSLPTLGRIKDIPTTLGACRQDGDAFRPVVTRTIQDDEPVIEPQ